MASNGNHGFVVVTGTSTGVGAATAVHLAENGFHVFAGVRRADDGEAVRAHAPDAITPVILDVTDESAISAAAATVVQAVGIAAWRVSSTTLASPSPRLSSSSRWATFGSSSRSTCSARSRWCRRSCR
jgi:NAD(P)-dependent dehydrogenase (short-subunit alcohol dehydrogenase family)